MLGRCERGHGVGEVEVGGDAELALHSRRVRGRGRQEGLLAGFLIDSRQIRVDQGVQKLHYELSVVWDLCLLGVRREKKGYFLSTFLSLRALLLNCSNTMLLWPVSSKKHSM